jgi:deferrochelatase/peroxidase EfeB
MGPAMTTPFDDVQRIVLRGSQWAVARHLVLRMGDRPAPLYFLKLLKPKCWPTPASVQKRPLQVSLGFTQRGLQHARVPDHVLAQFAFKSPAFAAGAALRANRYVGLSGQDGPATWNDAFGHTALDAVLSLHGMDEAAVDEHVDRIRAVARICGVHAVPLMPARRLEPPDGRARDETWVHFGYRDGLSQVGIEGWTDPKTLAACKPVSRYAPGEFLLGHPQQSGANPWIAGPGPRIWPEEIRRFFHNGSFGVLQQIEMDVAEFARFVLEASKATGLTPDEVRAKLCGRRPDGTPLAEPALPAEDDFNYEADAKGERCPFGAHVRRMNPRGDGVPHAVRVRPLLRRGMPYGPPEWGKGQAEAKRGLLAQFFCASIEDQYEHLVAEWGDRVPLGSADRGGARDPLAGAHALGDGAFEIPQDQGRPPLRLGRLRAFTHTRGLAYLFYPSLTALEGIADNCLWLARQEDEA